MPFQVATQPTYSTKDIRKLMVEYELRQKELARLLGVSVWFLGEVLNGKRPITKIFDRALRSVFCDLEHERQLKLQQENEPETETALKG